MKKISLLLTILLLVSFALFAIGSGEGSSGKDDQGNASAEATENNANLGEYSVMIDS